MLDELGNVIVGFTIPGGVDGVEIIPNSSF